MSETTSRDGPHAVRGYERGTTPVATRRSRRPKPDYARRRRNALVVLVALVALLVAVLWYMGNADEIRQGVRVGEVNVGGLTREEARAAVERHAAGAFEEIRFGDGAFAASGERLGVEVDAARAVEEAYSVGREGWVGARVFDVVRAYFLGGLQVDLDVEYDEEAARSILEEAAHEFYQRPQNASFSVSDDGRVEVEEGRQGRVLSREETLANLERALSEIDGEVSIAADYKRAAVSTQEI